MAEPSFSPSWFFSFLAVGIMPGRFSVSRNAAPSFVGRFPGQLLLWHGDRSCHRRFPHYDARIRLYPQEAEARRPTFPTGITSSWRIRLMKCGSPEAFPL
jgi:hypothetical protein